MEALEKKMDMVTEKEITDFWNSFKKISEAIVKEPNNSSLINTLDQYVRQLGEFDWEYGPSNTKEYYFCLSPNFQKHLLPLAEEIIRSAPDLNDWEFMASKPKKEWVSEWKILDNDGQEVKMNTENWKCVIYKFQDGTYDLDVKVGENLNVGFRTVQNAVDILLTNILGEKKYMELVIDVKIVKEFEKEDWNKAILIKHLDRYITYN